MSGIDVGALRQNFANAPAVVRVDDIDQFFDRRDCDRLIWRGRRQLSRVDSLAAWCRRLE